jgi:hypothetical protein
MTDDEKAAAAHLTGSEKDDVSAYYIHATASRRRRSLRGSAWRKAICSQCLGPRSVLKAGAKPGTCRDCHNRYITQRSKERHENYDRLYARPAVLILG